MFNLIKNLVPSGLLGAMAAKVTRWVATAAATALATWLYSLLSKYGLPTDGQTGDIVKEIAGGASSVILGLGALAFSLWDAQKVDAKITTAAATGSVSAADDAQKRADVAQVLKVAAAEQTAGAAAPKTKDELIATIKAGTF